MENMMTKDTTERNIPRYGGNTQKIWKFASTALYTQRPIMLVTFREVVQNSYDAWLKKVYNESLEILKEVGLENEVDKYMSMAKEIVSDKNKQQITENVAHQMLFTTMYTVEEKIRKYIVENLPEIKVTLTETETHLILDVVDNGCGMTEDTILSKFLCLTASDKVQGSVGGFGMAKAAILGPCDYWELWTLNNYLNSEMIDKEPIRKLSQNEIVDGCKISLYYEKNSETKGVIPESWNLEEVFGILATSSVPMTFAMVDVNGKKLEWKFDGLFLKEKPTFKSSDFNIYRLDKSLMYCKNETVLYMGRRPTVRIGVGSSYVRMNGLTQFADHMGYFENYFFVIDILTDKVPSDPEYPFNGGREKLNSDLNKTISAILKGYEMNPLSADKAHSKKDKTKIKYLEGKSLGEIKREQAEEARKMKEEAREREVELKKKERENGVSQWFSSVACNFMDVESREKLVDSPIGYKTCIKEMCRTRFNPMAAKNLKLLAAWAQTLVEVDKVNDIQETYGIGFIIDDGGTIAERYVEDGVTYYLINPNCLKISEPEGTMNILIYEACHEKAHYLYSDHNEYFTSTQGSLFRKMQNNILIHKRQIRKALMCDVE